MLRSRQYSVPLALVLGLVAGCKAEQPTTAPGAPQPDGRDPVVRAPAVAGAFYPGSAAPLTAQIQRCLSAAQAVNLPGEPVAVVVPHAGYDYSAPVAAWAYRQLQGKSYDTVILLGPSHRVALRGGAVSPEDAYQTPLGQVPLDDSVRAELLKNCSALQSSAAAHAQEHSLEVQLPFLQTVLQDFKIVPVVLGQPTLADCRTLGHALAAVLGRGRALLVISSDLSHYPSYDDATRSDRAMLAAVATLDPDKLVEANKKWLSEGLDNLECTMCGLWPAVTLAFTAQELGGCTAKVLHYANSGDTPVGDHQRVVGYGAVAVCRPAPAQTAADDGFTLDHEEQQYLLELARRSLTASVNGDPLPVPDSTNPKLTRKSGAFVTLKKRGQLRGCIGHIVARLPLQEVVVKMARAAALEDPRFPAVTPGELKELSVEISVLSPLQPLTSIDQVVVGKHGLLLTEGWHQGVLLPQVPVEQGWTRDQYLSGLCRKAGVADRAWERGATLQSFTAQVFGE